MNHQEKYRRFMGILLFGSWLAAVVTIVACAGCANAHGTCPPVEEERHDPNVHFAALRITEIMEVLEPGSTTIDEFMDYMALGAYTEIEQNFDFPPSKDFDARFSARPSLSYEGQPRGLVLATFISDVLETVELLVTF